MFYEGRSDILLHGDEQFQTNPKKTTPRSVSSSSYNVPRSINTLTEQTPVPIVRRQLESTQRKDAQKELILPKFSETQPTTKK